ncbi:MAG: exodeoxyribonuclease VII large subunit [Candidatus Methanomethylophilaceae archaeon]|nr:exodeoxyribonuclease VII large subunit [Candidatus Methanomethylophilaceae archaeon]
MSETITVTQLNTRVKDMITSSPAVRDVWVEGEISNLKKYPSGHYYMTLKDAGSEIRAVLFANSRFRVDFEPRDNMKVSAFGRVDMYVPRGQYQFIIDTMRKSGLGDLFLRYEALKRKLEAEGLFDPARKRPLPKYPRRIGVVTSQTGAVIHDIITTSATRFPADIILAPAQVQGDGAAQTIVAGMELLNRHGVDVIIVGRGGGSLEDLWPFNEEMVARAIARSKAPVVSAVGHETDFTIADFVADARAPTPTGAAAIILRDRSEISRELDALSSRSTRAVNHAYDSMRYRFDAVEAKLSPRSARDMTDMLSMRLDEMSMRLDSALKTNLRGMRDRFDELDSKLSPSAALQSMERLSARLDSMTASMDSDIRMRMERSSSRLSSSSRALDGLNPLNVLSRGYGMVTDFEGRVATSASSIEPGTAVRVVMRDGTISAEVTGKEMKE